MSKGFTKYFIGWVILFLAVNLVAFLIPVERDAGFWAGYVLIVIALLGQLFCAYYVFSADNATKVFYNIPIFMVAYTGLVASAIVGIIFMALGDHIPAWIGAIICVLILTFEALSILKASAAADIVGNIDETIRIKTSFVKLFTVETENLMSRATTPEIKEECRKVYEAARYSDPMSVTELESVEQDITWKFGDLKKAVADGDATVVKAAAEEVIRLIGDRNRTCKALK